MTGKTHLAFGIGSGCLCALLLYPDSIPASLTFCGAAAFGSLFPDIDNPSSIMGHILHPLSSIIRSMFGHRGFLHSPILGFFLYGLLSLLFSALRFPLGIYIARGFAVGYFGHLFLDMLTKGGIPLLYPLTRSKTRIGCVKTGGVGEGIVFVAACTAILVIVALHIFLTRFTKT